MEPHLEILLSNPNYSRLRRQVPDITEAHMAAAEDNGFQSRSAVQSDAPASPAPDVLVYGRQLIRDEEYKVSGIYSKGLSDVTILFLAVRLSSEESLERGGTAVIGFFIFASPYVLFEKFAPPVSGFLQYLCFSMNSKEYKWVRTLIYVSDDS